MGLLKNNSFLHPHFVPLVNMHKWKIIGFFLWSGSNTVRCMYYVLSKPTEISFSSRQIIGLFEP